MGALESVAISEEDAPPPPAAWEARSGGKVEGGSLGVSPSGVTRRRGSSKKAGEEGGDKVGSPMVVLTAGNLPKRGGKAKEIYSEGGEGSARRGNVFTRFLKFLVLQVFYMSLLVAIPTVWYRYVDGEHIDWSDPEGLAEKLHEAKMLISTGVAMFSFSYAYRSLPLDLIPDFIPIIGKFDDLLAGMLMGLGVAMMYAGFNYGSGEVPSEAMRAVELTRGAYNKSVPYVRWLVDLTVAGFERAKPYYHIAVKEMEPLLAQARIAAQPYVAKVSEVLEPYMAQVVAALGSFAK